MTTLESCAMSFAINARLQWLLAMLEVETDTEVWVAMFNEAVQLTEATP